MASIADRSRSHYARLCETAYESIVPEWADDEGKPAVLYAKPLTVGQKDRLSRKVKAAGGSELKGAVYFLLEYAYDRSTGDKAFKPTDMDALMYHADSEVIVRVCNELVGIKEEKPAGEETDPDDIEDLEKN